MNLKTIKEIAVAWLEYKRPFVKDSTFAAYALTVQNHIVPAFGESCELPETDVQQFVLQKLENGISVKTIKDILIVLKMVMKYGVKQSWLLHAEWDIKYPTSSAAVYYRSQENLGAYPCQLQLPKFRHLPLLNYGLAHR